MDPLLANHLYFIGHHRGVLTSDDHGTTVSTFSPEPSFFIPRGQPIIPPREIGFVRLFPWSDAGWPTRLEDEGFARTGELAYMRLQESLPLQWLREAAPLTTTRVDDRGSALVFAAIQAAAFLTDDERTEGSWVTHFAEQAVQNYHDPNQEFWIGWRDDDPQACALTVHSHGLLGIYAVATCPDKRRRGMSRGILGAIVTRLDDRIGTPVVLQVAAGSVAETMYRRLGFVEQYRSTIWRRTV